MRQRLKITGAVLIAIIGVATAWAFQPAPNIIRACPECSGEIVQNAIMSGNTFGARMWTDGKMEAPMLPDYPLLVKCPDCQALLWIAEAREIGLGGFFDENPGWPNAKKPGLPSESDLLRALMAGELSAEKDLYLRRRYWWTINDAYRTDTPAVAAFTPLQERLLRSLADVFDVTDPDQRIAKAEIFRELKMYGDCIRLLADPFDDDIHAKVGTFIKKSAEQKIWTVLQIPWN